MPDDNGDPYNPCSEAYIGRQAEEAEEADLIRVPHAIYQSREAAIAAGWPDAEEGVWQAHCWSPELVRGWIALDYRDTQAAQRP
jgi:hypothetical protein